jgi:hypothetical protein
VGDLQLGDVAGWLQAAGGMAQVFDVVIRRRHQNLASFGRLVEELSGLSSEEIKSLVRQHEAISELVGVAAEEAAKTASAARRRRFAMVAAAALRSDAAAPKLQPTQFLLRTLIALDDEHITLLTIIATPDGKQRTSEGWMLEGKVDGAVKRAEIEERWPGAADLLDPALAALEGARVVKGHQSYNGYIAQWALNDYGRRFLDFIIEGREDF